MKLFAFLWEVLKKLRKTLKTLLKVNNWGDFPLKVKELLNIFGGRFEVPLVKLHKL